MAIVTRGVAASSLHDLKEMGEDLREDTGTSTLTRTLARLSLVPQLDLGDKVEQPELDDEAANPSLSLASNLSSSVDTDSHGSLLAGSLAPKISLAPSSRLQHLHFRC